MPDTVGLDQHETTSLRGIANRARQDKGARFQNLYRLLDESNLQATFRRLRKDAAAGIDKVGLVLSSPTSENRLMLTSRN